MVQPMTAFALLDLAPIVEGGSAAEALAQAADLAQLAEELGYARYWVAEHHGMPGIASAATAVVIGHVGAATKRIRVGAGGIMLPNHPPLVIAEQFGTLDALFPGRIDLGLGRAPGSDQLVARAMRRSADPNGFPRDVLELMSYLADDGETGIHAVPGGGADVALWILGSSTFGAELAAALGLPYAFASHFAPVALERALATYRTKFKPSKVLSEPYVMLGFNVFAANTDEEAQFLASSAQQAFVALRSGNPGRLKKPVRDYRGQLGPAENALLDQVLSCSAVGAPETVRRRLQAFIDRTGADEIIFASMMFDHEARKTSLRIAAEQMQALRA